MNILSVVNVYTVITTVLLILLFAGLFIKKRRCRSDPRSRKATGVILALEKLALTKENHVEIKLLVMVMPERSRNFVGELIETVFLPDLLLMKIGDKIAVEYSCNSKLILSRPGA